MGAADLAFVELAHVEGLEIKHCPDLTCTATIGGPGSIVEHHDDGSHTMDWGGAVPSLGVEHPADGTWSPEIGNG